MISNRLKRVGQPLRHSNQALYSLISQSPIVSPQASPDPHPHPLQLTGSGWDWGVGWGRRVMNLIPDVAQRRGDVNRPGSTPVEGAKTFPAHPRALQLTGWGWGGGVGFGRSIMNLVPDVAQRRGDVNRPGSTPDEA